MNPETCPVPIQMKLPSSEWRTIDPREISLDDVAMLAVRNAEDGAFVPVLIVEGEVFLGDPDVESIADQCVRSISENYDHASVAKRRTTGTENSTSLLQLIEIGEKRGGRRFDLQQVQVIQVVQDLVDTNRKFVLSCSIIGEFKHAHELSDEFAEFVESVVLVPG